jgi:hypothetical protein
VTCQQTIKRIDTTPPTITCPANVTVACGGNTAPAVTGTATGVDACDPTVAISFSDATVAGICPAAPIIHRTWTAADDCGNTSTCNQNITLTDTEPPVIACTNVIIACSASSDPSNTGYPNVTNNCGGTSVFTYVDVYIFMGTFPECSIQRTWTATDNCGNSATCLQTIILKDLVLPTIFCPANVTIACSANTLPANTGSATATDNCAVAPTIAYADAVVISPTCPQNKTITRTWTTFDECGNSNTCVQVVTVIDNIAPTITCPANVTVQCTASTLPANTGSPSSSDNCDVTPTITFTDATVAGSCPQKYTITRAWKSTDDCGNFSTCNQTITVTDNVGPAVNCPANITILCSASTLPANTGSATATDNCSAPVVTYTDVTVAGACPQSYTITRTWKGTDACGNFTNCNQTIFIQDNLAPAMTCPANITILCTASTLPVNTGNPTSSDNCDITPTITFTDMTVAGGCPQAYTITRTWRSQDDCGNFINCVQTITVIDNLAPSINCPANLTIQCTANTLPVNTGNPTSSDNCDLTPTITYTDVTVGGDCPQEYTITRTWKTTDDCNNSTTCVQTIVVDDSTNPVLTCPANITIQCTASTLPANTGNPSSSDNCDATPTVTYTDATVAGACPQEYTITRTWKSTDDCGNFSTCNQVITVDDSMAPTITCPANLTLQCTASTLPPATGSMTASDNCDPNPMVSYADVTTASPTCPQEYSIA